MYRFYMLRDMFSCVCVSVFLLNVSHVYVFKTIHSNVSMYVENSKPHQVLWTCNFAVLGRPYK